MVDFVAQHVVRAEIEAVWAVVSAPERSPEWFEGVDRAEADGPPGTGQRHTIGGPWGNVRFEIDRIVDRWLPPRAVVWRDVDERLDGVPPEHMWHEESTLTIALEPQEDETLVTLHGRQLPASEVWRERLLASIPASEARLERSLERLAALVESGLETK